ncbi:MAG: iron-sulfur cluster-binding protein [Anaerolineae bacterium]|nr:iron-sulfur cluster-binding protein [Anaerolineae bacterium]
MTEHGYPTQPFDVRVQEALDNPTLGPAMAAATERFLTGRERTWHELGDAQAVRRAGRAARERAIAHLDETLDRLASNIEANGGHVHWAADAQEAGRIVLDICQQAGAKSVVKSKSMLSEEIGLNQVLETAGLKVVETDLGEWIIQLAGETPSHLIAPAVHKTKAQVAELFSQVIGRHVPPDAPIPELTRIAREQLRQAFLEAGVGISGVNFAIAETGTISLVTNEGNGRYVTGMPPVHIAVMGAEKVIGTWEEWTTTLKLLTRSATGQRISSYVTTVSGPRRPDDADGPDEFHLVIVDNGRSRLLGSTFRESMYCIRCGACLNACPVYREIGGHAYGGVYAGPIGAVQTPLLFGLDKFPELAHASSLCGACLDACPMMIDIPRMLLELRRIEAEGDPQNWTRGDGGRRTEDGGRTTDYRLPTTDQDGTPEDIRNITPADSAAVSRRQGAAKPGTPPLRPMLERLIFRVYRLGASWPFLYRLGAKSRWLLKLFARGERIPNTPIPILKNWTRYRDFPLPAAKPFHARWDELKTED